MDNREIPDLIIESNKTDESMFSRLSGSLAQLKTNTVTETKELIRSQIDKLINVQETLRNILKKIQQGRKQCQATISKLEREGADLNRQIGKSKEEIRKNDEEEQLRAEIKGLHKNYISVGKERIHIAESLNVKLLSKANIENRKSQANAVFKWILAVIYNQPESKFYWPNFKEQAFQVDKGKDFMERMGKISALSTKEEQRIRTETFLENYPSIIKSPQLQGIMPEVEKIHEIALCFQKGYKIAEQIHSCEGKIQKNKERSMERYQENSRLEARINALEGRMQINKQLLAVFEESESTLIPKSEIYSKKIAEGKKAIMDLQRINGSKSAHFVPNESSEQTQSCRLF